MGGGSETIKDAQITVLSEDFGKLKKKILLETGKYISVSGDLVVKAQGQAIVDIKGMYNKGYLKAMGYAPNDSIEINKISDGKVLEYTKNNIDSSATYVLDPRVGTLSTMDKVLIELQDKPNFKRSEMSFTHTDSKKYYYFTSVQNGSYIDISCYLNDEDTVTPYLENKYPDGYAILDMNTYPLVDNGSVYWKAEVEYIYYEDEEVNGEIVTLQKLGLVTEHIDCVFIYLSVEDIDEAQMNAIAQQHSGPFTTTGSYTTHDSEGGITFTTTVTGTFTVTYIGNGEFSYDMDAPNPHPGKWLNSMGSAWENGVRSYQTEKITQIDQAIQDNVRKLIWDYGVISGDFDSVRRTYVLGDILDSFIIKEQTDAYPIIPLKRNFNLVNSKKMDIVLKEIGIEGKDFHDSLKQKEICDAYLFFGIPINGGNPGLIEYIFEFFTTLSNVRENYNKNAQRQGATSLNITFDGMGIHQNYNVQSWVVVEPATRPIGTYWFQEVSETVITGYEEVNNPEGVGKIKVPITETSTYKEYYHQESESYYIRIRPTVSNYWYMLGGLQWGNTGRRGGSSDKIKLRIPLIRHITNRMSFNLLCDVLEQSMCIAYYTEVVVKTKWYQSGFFKFVVYAVSTFTGQFWAIALMVSTEIIIDKFGAAIGGVFQIIATAVLLVTGNIGSAFEMTVKNVMLTASQVLSLVSGVNNLLFSIKYESKAKDYSSMLGQQEEEKKKLEEEYDKLHENEGMIVNMFNNFKSLDDIDSYYNIAVGDFDSYYLMLDYATDYDKFYVNK